MCLLTASMLLAYGSNEEACRLCDAVLALLAEELEKHTESSSVVNRVIMVNTAELYVLVLSRQCQAMEGGIADASIASVSLELAKLLTTVMNAFSAAFPGDGDETASVMCGIVGNWLSTNYQPENPGVFKRAVSIAVQAIGCMQMVNPLKSTLAASVLSAAVDGDVTVDLRIHPLVQDMVDACGGEAIVEFATALPAAILKGITKFEH